MDWGFNAPGVCLWWAAVGDGHWHIAHEYKFQQTSVESVAREWHARNKRMGLKKVQYVAADPSMWAKTGHGKGESIAETLLRFGLPMLRGHELLRDAPDGRPWLTVDVSCTYGLRSLPAQVSDKKDPDDIDTGGDDHWVDAWRYGAMSRLIYGRTVKKTVVAPPMSLGWIKQQTAARDSLGPLAR